MSDTVQIAFIVCGAIVALAVIGALLYFVMHTVPNDPDQPLPSFLKSSATPSQWTETTHKIDLSGIPQADRAQLVRDVLGAKPLEEPRV